MHAKAVGRRAALFLGGAIALMGAVPALAADDSTTVGEVVVTAQKREEKLQDVPVSVTVVGETALKALNIESGTEIARQTPNLRVSNLGNEDQPKFALRGISTPDFDLNTSSPTGVFYDEVYVASQFLGGPQVYDLERVEVLRGPQGTLYGKNTTGGAINFITKKPTFEKGGDIRIQSGEYAFFHADGAFNMPLIEDKLAARVAFSTSRSDGYVKNFNPDGRDLSSIDNYAVRASLRWRPDDTFDATLRVSTSRANPTNIGVINVGLGPGGTNAFGVNPRINPLTGQAFKDREIYSDRTNGEIQVKGDGATLTMSKVLGDYTLTSITSYLEGFFLNRVDGDGSIAPLLAIDFYADTEEQSQDLRIASNGDGKFNFIAGLYYGHDKVGIRTDWNFFDDALLRNQTYDQARTSYAVYADGTLDVSDAMQLYAGVRWTKDKGQQTNFQVLGAGAPVITVQPKKEYDDSAPTGRLGMRYKFSPDIMGYLQYSRGYRSGAINGAELFNAANINVAKPEYLDAFEAGLKTQLMDHALTLNTSAFHYTYKNQQFLNTITVGQSEIINAGESEIYGLEVETVWRATPDFTVTAGLGLLHAQFNKLSLGREIGGVLVQENLKGKDLIEAPHVSFNFALDYAIPLSNGAKIALHGDGNYVGDQFYTARNDPLSKTKAHWDTNARIAYQKDNFELAIWGKNLNDNTVPGGIVGPDTSTFIQIFRTPTYPRRFGLEANYKF